MTRPTAGALWSGPALLVPVTVDALVLSQPTAGNWSWLVPEYNLVQYFRSPARLFESVLPAPIDPAGNMGALPGVMLRWALPDALTAGGAADQDTGEVSFPPIPNRWLVLRQVPGSAAASSAWILASDYLGGTGSQYYANGAVTKLGACWPLAQWPGEAALPAGLDPPLTAIGPGLPTFASYLPNVQHILAFLDPLTGVAAGPVSYLVCGWYAGKAADPLAGWQATTDWTAVTSGLGWSLGADLPAAAFGDPAAQAAVGWAAAHGYTTDSGNPHTFLPSKTICHGLVCQVNWPGPGQPTTSSVPQPAQNDPASLPGLTVGQTSVDALATTVATTVASSASGGGATSAQVAEALTALLTDQFPLLDAPDGAAQLAALLQGTWFQQLPGGTRWVLTTPQAGTPSGAADTPLTAAQAAALDALNSAQQQVDASTRQVASLQWEIYALWWKLGYVTANQVNPIPNAAQAIAGFLTTKQSQATNALSDLTTATTQRDAANQQLTADLGGLLLKQVPEPPFYRPNDPALLIQGVGRSYAHGEDGRFSADGGLYCRFTGQTLDALLVTGTAAPVTAQALGLTSLAVPADAPAELADLATEAFFLDPGNAHAIAAAASNPPQPDTVVAGQQTLIWNNLVADPSLDQQTIASKAGLASAYGPVAVPSKVGVEYWAPPWAPLHLDWSVSYYATTPPTGGWTFPPVSPATALDAQTAQWTGGIPPPTSVTIQGRTLLTPQATDALAARLERLNAEFGGAAELQPYVTDLTDAINYLTSASVLSQALGGLGDRLLQRDPTQNQQPDLTTLGQWLAPAGGPAFTPTAVPDPASVIPLSPVRAGFITIEELWVVDDFGQRYDVISALARTAGEQAGPDLAPAPSPGLLQLKPRLAQPSRLLLRFLDAADDTKTVGLWTAANPVCGWLIPNLPDDSVLVYDQDGVLRGELLLAQSGGATPQSQALWLPAPDLTPPSAQTAPPSLDNPHLAMLVASVLTAASPATALADLLATIEKASWAIAPSGPNAAQLATLIGFPVAVTRAQLLLELEGNPATSQRWADTGQDLDGGISTANFPVQLGSDALDDDGVVGYFLDGDPGHLVSVYGPSAGGYATNTTVSLVPGTPVPVTLLLHPQGTAHAFSGLLPPTVTALPAAFQAAPVSATEVTFRAGPLLTPAAAVQVPVPAFGGGEWAWLQYAGPADPARPRPLRPVDTVARLADAPPGLRDGWLRLTLTGQPTLLSYVLTPTALVTGTGSSASLTLTVYNAGNASVTCDSITVTLPVGTDSGALTSTPELISATAAQPASWSFQAAAPPGTFTASPVSADTTETPGAVAPGVALTFTLAGIGVNPVPGLSVIQVAESAGTTQATATLTLERFLPT